MFRVFGIQLSVHASFALLLVYEAFAGWMEGGRAGLGYQVLLVLLFFVCVVLHELGHSLTARRYGVQVPRILLMPIGGMAEFDRIPREPRAELLITFAGPAVNFVIFGLMLPFYWSTVFGDKAFEEFSLLGVGTLLTGANLVMGIFNLLPVYPMDGGRVLRAILAKKFPYIDATRYAVTVTRFLAPILAAGALMLFVRSPSPGPAILSVLFVFIFLAGNAEYRLLVRREREAAYWAELARRMNEAAAEPPLLQQHGPN
ncbi:MAG TPA: site-2 protease family protein [Candidatus Didemnitutus sp.]|nr:site-2 protease family protein [Candidatus Didemnitutus sp.]